ncbi:unnamed protein product [Protopolystoma xenopodis]|uniref:Uncharacterized protein n=1 Tax=Protopolystoma xenopodis TaxID=117903 RepID=A0A3S5ACM7_9PLAT|nr:unnamed protein product [Protopolystoma xenopodis]
MVDCEDFCIADSNLDFAERYPDGLPISELAPFYELISKNQPLKLEWVLPRKKLPRASLKKNKDESSDNKQKTYQQTSNSSIFASTTKANPLVSATEFDNFDFDSTSTASLTLKPVTTVGRSGPPTRERRVANMDKILTDHFRKQKEERQLKQHHQQLKQQMLIQHQHQPIAPAPPKPPSSVSTNGYNLESVPLFDSGIPTGNSFSREGCVGETCGIGSSATDSVSPDNQEQFKSVPSFQNIVEKTDYDVLNASSTSINIELHGALLAEQAGDECIRTPSHPENLFLQAEQETQGDAEMMHTKQLPQGTSQLTNPNSLQTTIDQTVPVSVSFIANSSLPFGTRILSSEFSPQITVAHSQPITSFDNTQEKMSINLPDSTGEAVTLSDFLSIGVNESSVALPTISVVDQQCLQMQPSDIVHTKVTMDVDSSESLSAT